jgi:hypothetical protein
MKICELVFFKRLVNGFTQSYKSILLKNKKFLFRFFQCVTNKRKLLGSYLQISKKGPAEAGPGTINTQIGAFIR